MTKTPIPEENLSPKLSSPTRPDPPLVGDERELLTSFLDFYRETIALKCAGVPADGLAERAVPPSGLTLHGLIRHLAGAEQWWFSAQFAGEDGEPLYYSDDDPARDFEDLSGDFADALAVWRAQCQRSREIAASAASLDHTGVHQQTGKPVSLRRIMLWMIAEYARHSGHADLLRERLDGQVGT